MDSLQDTYSLYNGSKIPCIGFGTWKIPEGEAAIESIMYAIDVGYRHIDTASAYENEVSVGRAVSACGVPRSELFITSKLWNTDRGYDNALAAFETSLFKLGLDYLDLYLVHWPAFQESSDAWVATNADTWRALEHLYLEGKVKAIGVSNFKVHHLDPLLESAYIKPMVNQLEFHPGFMQNDVRAYCEVNDILIEAWSPLGRGALLSDARLSRIAGYYGKSVSQICLRWCLQHGTLPLPKSSHADRIRENAEVFDFVISADDMAYIDGFPEVGFSGFDPDKVKF